jgi:hypothetical protein
MGRLETLDIIIKSSGDLIELRLLVKVGLDHFPVEFVETRTGATYGDAGFT